MLVGYLIIIALLVLIIIRCNKSSRAPFGYIESPANTSGEPLTPDLGPDNMLQQLRNKTGCEQQMGIWKDRGDGTGVCVSYHGTPVPLQ